MNAAFLIASSELRDRSRLFLIAAAMAVVPFGAAFAVRENRPLAIAVVATSLALLYACSLAIALGVSTVGRELTEKRLPFLFAKPVSATSIWAGKMAAGLLTVFGVLAIVVLPAFAFVNSGWNDMWLGGWKAIVLNALVLIPVLFLGGHIASTMFRSRSPRIALDVVFLGLALFALCALLRPILLAGAGDIANRILIGIGGALLVLFGLVPVWQLARGGIDPRRNHAALSNALWIGVAVVLVAAGTYVMWVISPPLSSLKGFLLLNQSATGSSVFVSGVAPNRGSFVASYAIDTATGHRQRLDLPSFPVIYVSPDGRTLAWMQNTALLPRPAGPASADGTDARDFLERGRLQKGTGAFRLMVRRPDSGGKTIETPLVVPMPHRAQLSDDGSRIAMTNERRVEVYEVASGRLLAAVHGIEATAIRHLFFAGPNVLRILENEYPNGTYALKIHQIDLVRRKITNVDKPLGRTLYPSPIYFSGDGARMLVGNEVLDARTGEPLLSLPGHSGQRRHAVMLRDGSLIATGASKLVHMDASGHVRGEVPIGAGETFVVGEIGTSKLLVGSDEGTMIVDLATGKVAVSVSGVGGPILGHFQASLPRFAEDATFVGLDRSRKLVLWDAKTGAKRPLPS